MRRAGASHHHRRVAPLIVLPVLVLICSPVWGEDERPTPPFEELVQACAPPRAIGVDDGRRLPPSQGDQEGLGGRRFHG